MKKVTLLLASVLLLSCLSDNQRECQGEKALALDYYSRLMDNSSGMQTVLLEQEMNRYLENDACRCMTFTQIKQINNKYYALMELAEGQQLSRLNNERLIKISKIQSQCK